jgi:hypothetical protein
MPTNGIMLNRGDDTYDESCNAEAVTALSFDELDVLDMLRHTRCGGCCFVLDFGHGVPPICF